MLDFGTKVISLVLASPVQAAGGVLEGEVLLNLAELPKTPLEEIHVKFRGLVATEVKERNDDRDRHKSKLYLIRDSVSLWRKQDVYPLPEQWVLRLPFAFHVPIALPPSCHYKTAHKAKGTVSYWVKAVGVRSGLRWNKRITQTITLLPCNLRGAELSRILEPGWSGDWAYRQFTKDVRRGVIGEHSRVTLTLALPAIESFPTFTPIPFTLTATSISKTMQYDVRDEGKRIFPAPPITPRGVEMKLLRRVRLQADAFSEWDCRLVADLGGLGLNAKQSECPVEVSVMDKVWTQSEFNLNGGNWKQETRFRSHFTLTCHPTFESGTMDVTYALALKLPFPGYGNDFEAFIPINVVSSMTPASLSQSFPASQSSSAPTDPPVMSVPVPQADGKTGH